MSGAVLLAITPDILSPWSDRDLTYEFGPIEGLQTYRDGNNTMRLADPVGGLATKKKYRLTITGDDLEAFAFGGIWPGQVFTVDLATSLTHQLASAVTTVTLERTVVPGTSVTARTKDGAPLTVSDVTGGVVTVASHTGQSAFVRYQPRLTMVLIDPWSNRFARAAWVNSNSIVLEEQ